MASNPGAPAAEPHDFAHDHPVASKMGAVLRVTSGNFLEQFDFFLFGFYASDIAHVFFPSTSPFLSLMSTLMANAVGFFMRPLGSIVLGSYIDKVGRRKGLIVTLGIMASGTVLIAFVPGYASIGILAPLLVVLGRLLQGFSAGAELGGVSVYLSEIATPGHKGFYVAWQSASQQVSIMAAAALGFGINAWLSPAEVDAWGWRIPFFVGCCIVPLIFLLRRKLEETAEFSARKVRPTTREVFASMAANWQTVILGMLFVSMTTTAFYFITNYTPTFGRTLHLKPVDTLTVTLFVAISNFIWLPIGGAISDRIGRKPLLIGATLLTALTAYPALAWLAAAPSFERLLLVELMLSFYYGLYNGAMVVALTEVMPAAVRVVGFSLAYSLATAIFGGVTQPISAWLAHETGNNAAPGLWLTFAAVCGLIATLALYRRSGAHAKAGYR